MSFLPNSIKLKKLCFFFYILLNILENLQQIHSYLITPHKQHPLSMTFIDKITSTGGQIVEIRFKLNEKSSGLIYKQYIGVLFENEEFFSNVISSTSSNTWSCGLKSTSVTFSVTSEEAKPGKIRSFVNNNNIAYCRFDDRLNVLPINQELTLIMTFSTKFSQDLIKQISLFTTTSNQPDQIIIDSLPVLGTIGYTLNSQIVSLNSVEETIKSGPSTTIIYPYNKIDIKLGFSVQTSFTIMHEDYIYVFKYNTTAFKATTNVSTVNASKEAKHLALVGGLTADVYEANSIRLNIEENLVNERSFKISFNDWEALDTNTLTGSKVKLCIFYKNTYSLISYSEIFISPIQPARIIGESNVAATVHHPEWFSLFDGMAWPLQFNFNFQQNLIYGGYVLIRQENTVDTASRWTFVAATCEFGEGFSSQDFGTRNNCYPLRNDFKYTATLGLTTSYEGSGIFFRMKTINIASKVYSLTVWGFAERCGTTTDPTAAVTTFYTNFTFTIRVYKNILLDKEGENRFIDSTNPYIAELKGLTMSEKCFAGEHLDPANLNVFKPNADALYTQETSTFMTTRKTNKIFDPTSNVTIRADAYGFFGDSLTFQKGAAGTKREAGALTEKFLYSSSNNLGTSSYFVLSALNLIALDGTSKKIADYIPSDCINTTAAANHESSRYEFIFSKRWFVKGDDYKSVGCFMSFSYNNNQNDVLAASTPLLKDSWQKMIPNTLNASGEDNTNVVNFLYSTLAFKNTPPTESIDKIRTYLPPHTLETDLGRTSIYRIISIKDTVAAGVRSKFSTVKDCNEVITVDAAGIDYKPGFLETAFFTTCVKWSNTTPQITSLYTYFDFQWHNIKENSTYNIDDPITRVWRFIKLFPEGGIFQDVNEKTYKGLTDARLVTGHFAWTAAKQQPLAICVIEINGKALSDSWSAGSKTLTVWMFATSLLDVDFSDAASQYPVGPIATGSVTSYGLNSGQTISTMNRMTSKIAAGNVITNVTNQPDTYLDRLYFATGGNYNNEATKLSVFEPNRSMYQFYLGSVILITGFTSNTITTTSTTVYPALVIPFYCPQYSDSTSTTYGTAGVAYSIPTVSVSWIDMTDYNHISIVKSIVTDSTKSGMNIFTDRSVKDPIGTYQLASIGLYKGIESAAINTNNNWSGQATTQTVNSTYNKATIRFNAYEPASNSNKVLNIFSLTATTKVSSFFSIATETIQLDTTLSGFGSFTGVYSWDKSVFYVNQRKFNKAIFSVISPTWDTGNSKQIIPAEVDLAVLTVGTVSSLTITGFQRPSISVFESNLIYNTLDFVGVSFANSVGTSTHKPLMNFAYDETSPGSGSSLRNFVLDWNPINQDFTNVISSSDKSESVYKADANGDFRISFKAPGLVPAGGQVVLELTDANFLNSTYSLCGLEETTNGIITECSITIPNVTCYNTKASDTFLICCYNAILNVDEVKFKSTKIYAPLDTTNYLNIGSYLSTSLYATTTDPMSTYNSGQSNGTDLRKSSTTSFAYVTNIIFEHIAQHGGIGIAKIKVSLPRELVRGSTIDILSADFKNLSELLGVQIKTEPFCKVSFNTSGVLGASWDSGDVILDSCYYNTQSTRLIIKTKNILYKCGLNFSKNIVVYLNPVLVSEYKDIPAKIAYESIQGSAISFSVEKPFTSTNSVITKEPIVEKIKLCDITKVNPNVVGELADYYFEFDMPDSDGMNEISIFFDTQLFGFEIKNIICYYNKSSQNCEFVADGLLNIRFDSVLPKNIKIEIILSNIYNPSNTKDKKFICTVNSAKFTSDYRINIIKGYGTISTETLPSKADPGLVLKSGTLQLMNHLIYTHKPRELTEHIFNVAFDKQMADTDITIKNNPKFVVTFPDEYKLDWFPNVNGRIKANLTEIVLPEFGVDEQIQRSFPNVVPEILGNKISLPLGIIESDFVTKKHYWKIQLFDVMSPPDKTVYVGQKTTGLFSVLLTNDINDNIYRVYTNLNSLATYTLTQKINEFLKYNRGYQFNYAKLWVLDIQDELGSLNTLNLFAGRYKKFFLNIRSSTGVVEADQATIELKHKNFRTFNATYSISSSLKGKIEGLIGLSCGEPFGDYLVRFNYILNTKPKFFTEISPITIKVYKNNPLARITAVNPGSIPSGGSTFITYDLSEPNVDPILIKWDPTSFTSKIETITIPSNTKTISTFYLIKTQQMVLYKHTIPHLLIFVMVW